MIVPPVLAEPSRSPLRTLARAAVVAAWVNVPVGYGAVPGTGGPFRVLEADAAGSQDPDVAHDPATPSIPPEARGALVLFVDDEPLRRAFAMKVLGQAGFVTETLGDGAPAVERRFQDPVPAVIVMNWQMFGMHGDVRMDGDVAIRLIREREAAEGLPRMPILFESGDILSSKVRSADADGLLAMPCNVDQLVEAVLQVGWPSRAESPCEAEASAPSEFLGDSSA